MVENPEQISNEINMITSELRWQCRQHN